MTASNKYEGSPCKKCGATLRYFSNRSCVACQLTKQTTAEKKMYKRLNRQRNKEHVKEYNARPENRAKRAANKRRYCVEQYGINQADKDHMLLLQQGICPICEIPMVRPCVDHDHTTGKIRGLLCSKCNLALGYLKDNPQSCRNAALYLES